MRQKPYSARSSSCVFSSAYRPSRSECHPCGLYPRIALGRAAPPAAHTCLGGSPTCSGGKPLATLPAPSVQNCASLARSDAMPEPVLALSAAIVRLVRALHSGSLIGQPGYGARCGKTACPALAGACRHSLRSRKIKDIPTVLQRWPGCAAEPGATGTAWTPAVLSRRTRNISHENAKTSGGNLPPPFHASAYRPDMVLWRTPPWFRAFRGMGFHPCSAGDGDVG